jgi:hypothetical protein
MSDKTWVPIRVGAEVVDTRPPKQNSITIESDRVLSILSNDGWFTITLPDDVRLCRLTEATDD